MEGVKPKKKRRFSANAKSKEWLEDQGWAVTVGEQNIKRFDKATGKWIVFKRDLYGFGDLLACKPHELPTLGPSPRGDIALIQSTTGSNAAARITKIVSLPTAWKWLQAGGLIVCHSWRKIKVKRGGKAFTWELSERPVTLQDFPTTPAAKALPSA